MLDDVKKEATSYIDSFSDNLIKKLLGERVLEYIEAEKQAHDYYIAQYTGAIPSYVKQWADIKLKTPQWSADDILQKSINCKKILFNIRLQRLSSKENIRKATTIEQIEMITSAFSVFETNLRSSLEG